MLTGLCSTLPAELTLPAIFYAKAFLLIRKALPFSLRPMAFGPSTFLRPSRSLQRSRLSFSGFKLMGRMPDSSKEQGLPIFRNHCREKEKRKEQPSHEVARKLEQMTSVERFSFWEGEFSRCIKCYACRAACPMCWCRRCVVDNNQPQW